MHSLHDQDDVCNKEPEDWDQVLKTQQVLEAVFRSTGAETAAPNARLQARSSQNGNQCRLPENLLRLL